MRCLCCNKNLSDFESTRKDKVTGKYLDTCSKCTQETKEDIADAYSKSVAIPVDEREDDEF